MLAEKGGVTFPNSFGIMVLHGKNMYLNDVFHGFYELKPCRNRHREIGSSHTCYTYVHPRKCKKEKGGFLIKKP